MKRVGVGAAERDTRRAVLCDVGETCYTSLSTLWEYTCWTKGLATLRSLHRTVCLLLARSRERDDEREATRTESEATSAAGETAKKVNGMGQHETA